MHITHMIPGKGLAEIKLHEPAAQLYQCLSDNGEIGRLRELPHAGIQAYVLPGIAHTRWDYTANMLFVADQIQVRGARGRGKFILGNVEFGSLIAAVQVLGLLTNIGHLPGTFGVEKGALQWMVKHQMRVSDLPWPSKGNINLQLDALDTYVAEGDYAALHLALGAYKLDQFSKGNAEMQTLLWSFYVPALVGEALRTPNQEQKWAKLDRLHQIAQRVSYMNLDMDYTVIPVRFELIQWLAHMNYNMEIDELLDYTQDIFGTLEHVMFQSLYLREEGRIALAWATDSSYRVLESSKDGVKKVDEWLRLSDIRHALGAATPTAGMLKRHNRVEFDCHDRFLPKIASVAAWEVGLRNRIPEICRACVCRQLIVGQ